MIFFKLFIELRVLLSCKWILYKFIERIFETNEQFGPVSMVKKR